MSLLSRIESLRRLAERPGTEHEGAVAREMLARLEAKCVNPSEQERWAFFEEYLRTGSHKALDLACGRGFNR